MQPRKVVAVADRQTPFRQERKEKMLIVGTGFVGLGLSNALKRNAIPFEAIEAQNQVGGTSTFYTRD